MGFMARTFMHPSPEDFTIDGVLYALSDPIRRHIVTTLYNSEGMSCSKTCDHLSPSTISFHHRILRECGLIRSKKVGVEVINSLRLKELNKRFPGLVESIIRFHRSSLFKD
jgi:DNA-binding transcriptional ArsR family regulator